MTGQESTPQNSAWETFITPFANSIGKSVEEVTTALKPLVGEPGNEAIDLLKSEDFTPLDQIQNALGAGTPTARLKKAVLSHLRSTAPAAAAPSPASLANASFDALPPVPDDAAWLQMLKTGGELKVNETTVVSGMRAALASRLGLFDLPATLVGLMESHAESLDEPVGRDFFALRKLLTKRSYAEIFAALDIDGGSFATQARKSGFVDKMNRILWPELLGFQNTLKGWTDSWQQSFGNPSAMMSMLAVTMAGGRGAAMPPGMMQPPATDGLRDAAESVINRINQVFAGLGIPIASAMAYDAQNIKQVLENPSLPAHVGATNRDQMLKMLRVDVQADYVRLERNITRYALGIMEFPKVPADAEIGYITSLLMLGSQIPWEKLSGAHQPARSSSRPMGRVTHVPETE